MGASSVCIQRVYPMIQIRNKYPVTNDGYGILPRLRRADRLGAEAQNFKRVRVLLARRSARECQHHARTPHPSPNSTKIAGNPGPTPARRDKMIRRGPRGPFRVTGLQSTLTIVDVARRPDR